MLFAAPGLDNTKFEKGREHDRQALGFILPANTLLHIRQPNNDAGNARLRLLCNDSSYEKPLTLNGNWQTISTTVDSPGPVSEAPPGLMLFIQL